MTDKKTVNIDEAAKILGIGRSSAYEAVKSGEIPHIRFGKRIIVPLAALERMLEQAGRNAQTEKSSFDGPTIKNC